MNLRLVICIVAAVGLMGLRVLAADAPSAAGSAAGDVPTVPMDVGITETAQNSLNAATFTGEVTQKVGAEVQKLEQSANDPGTVKMVRTWLISQNPPSSTGPYQQAYVNALNTAFLGALGQGDPAVNFRVNVGIVIANLSGSKEGLGDTVIKLLQDKCPAVVLWGERAAESIFPLAMQNANAPFNAQGGMGGKILDAVVKSVTTQPDAKMGGDVAEAAFRAVNPRLWERKLPPAPAPFGALIDANLAMQKTRIGIYQDVGVPENPLADTYPSYLLFTPNVWQIMTPVQQLNAVQNAVDLTSYMGQRAATQPANKNQELVAALKEQGQWIANLGGTILNDGQVQAAGNEIKALHADLPGKQIADACTNACTQIQQDQIVSGWSPGITQPVDISGSQTGTKGAAGTPGGTATSLAPQQ